MLDKRAKRSIKEQIAAEKAELQKLAEIKQYLHREFVATTAEQDAVLDVIAQVCKENNLTLGEVLALCDEEYLDNSSITDYLADRINEWRDNYGDQHAADSEVPKESMLGFVEDF